MKIELRNGDTSVSLIPHLGGAIVDYCTVTAERSYNWLLPAEGERQSCFAMLPWCSRIANGRFSFQGRSLQLPGNNPPEPHSIHGHGWQTSWRLVSADDSSAVMEYQHQPDAWPWHYLARQHIVLEGRALQVTLSLQNIGASDMPAGMGLHPYFSVTPKATISTQVTEVWALNESLHELQKRPLLATEGLSDLAVGTAVMDNVFSGWQQQLLLTLPEWRASVSVTASYPFAHLILYATRQGGFICIEPVSNVANAFNLSAERGAANLFQVIAPGETLSGSVLISPLLLNAATETASGQ